MYWRRRALALGGAALAAVLLVWSVVAMVGGGDPPAVKQPRPPLSIAAPPAEPPPCRDEATRVTAEPVRPVYAVGERVALRFVVANIGGRDCVRDTNRTLRELVVSAPNGERLWSSHDCDSESTNERPLLRPGQVTVNEVLWSAHTSLPGCPTRRQELPAGDYLAVAKLGPLTSAPAPFRLVAQM